MIRIRNAREIKGGTIMKNVVRKKVRENIILNGNKRTIKTNKSCGVIYFFGVVFSIGYQEIDT
jgi:hypothetical protein